MMNECEKSDPVIVAVKPTNEAERSAAEPVEPRAGTKGNAGQQSTSRTPSRTSVSQALERIRQVCRHSPEVGAVCGKAARTVLCGGRSAMSVPTAIGQRAHRSLSAEADCSSPNWSRSRHLNRSQPFSPMAAICPSTFSR